MSRTYAIIRNSHQNQSKLNHRSYFKSPNEPWEHMFTDVPPELEVELLENSGPMRMKIRRRAQRMRTRNA